MANPDPTAEKLRTDVEAALEKLRRVFPRQNRWRSYDLHMAIGGYGFCDSGVAMLAIRDLRDEGLIWHDGDFWRPTPADKAGLDQDEKLEVRAEWLEGTDGARRIRDDAASQKRRTERTDEFLRRPREIFPEDRARLAREDAE